MATTVVVDKKQKKRKPGRPKQTDAGKPLSPDVAEALAGALKVKTHFMRIRPEEVQRWPYNPRRVFDKGKLEELAASMKTLLGMVEPIVVRTVKAVNGITAGYEGLAGERRYRAAALAGIEELPCVVYSGLSEHEAAQLALVENLQREDLTPIEEARGLRQLKETGGLNQTEIAKAVGRSRPAVANLLRLLQLPKGVQELLDEGKLTARHGYELLRFRGWPAIQEKIAELAVTNAATVKDLAEPVPFRQDLEQAALVWTEWQWGDGDRWWQEEYQKDADRWRVGDKEATWLRVVCLDRVYALKRAKAWAEGAEQRNAEADEIAEKRRPEVLEELKDRELTADELERGSVWLGGSDEADEASAEIPLWNPLTTCSAEACPCYKVGKNEQGEEVAQCLDRDALWAKQEELRDVEEKAKKAETEELKEKRKPLYEALKAKVVKELAEGNSPFTGC